MSILELRGISKSFGKRKILDNIDYILEEPDLVALIGPNGVGKSSLLNIIANIISKDTGEVKIFGKSNRDISVYKKYSYMMDNSVLYDNLTGFDHIEYIANSHGLGKDDIEKAVGYLDVGGFLDKRTCDYSLGMKQQLLFTMAILNDPDFLVLDEPFNGLDPSKVIKLREILIDFKEKGKTILLSSHNLAEVDMMTSRVLFLKDGKLIEEDISKYEEEVYYFSLDNVDGLDDILKSFIYTLVAGEVKVIVKKGEVQRLLKNLMETKTILSIRNEKIGAERRYKELYSI